MEPSDFVEVPHKVILHVDLDCFYCQVEQKRLGIPRDVPCAVQQWEGLIAVNYAARGQGVTRHMRVHEAKQKCPELQLVHVQTIGGTETVGHDGVEGSAADRGSAKASLQRYRMASGEILRLLQKLVAPGTLLEKASIDEAYLDVTSMVEAELQFLRTGTGHAAGGQAFNLRSACQLVAEENVVLGGPLGVSCDFDARLVAGATIALRLRRAVHEQLQFTMSAGIASNKLLAKLGSAKNKPNKQTVVAPRAVADLMQDMPLGKIRGLGGKLGAALEQQFGASTAGQVQAVPWQQLLRSFPERARWIAETVRGICHDAVTPKSQVKSINSCKSFEPVHDLGGIEKWVMILADELAQRMLDDEADNRRRAKSLVLHYRGTTAAGERSVRCAVPQFGKDGASAAPIAAAVMKMFRKLTDALPCVRIAISAAEFSDMPADDSRAITKFFANAAKQQKPQSPLPQSGPAAHQYSRGHSLRSTALHVNFTNNADPVQLTNTTDPVQLTNTAEPVQCSRTTSAVRLANFTREDQPHAQQQKSHSPHLQSELVSTQYHTGQQHQQPSERQQLPAHQQPQQHQRSAQCQQSSDWQQSPQPTVLAMQPIDGRPQQITAQNHQLDMQQAQHTVPAVIHTDQQTAWQPSHTATQQLWHATTAETSSEQHTTHQPLHHAIQSSLAPTRNASGNKHPAQKTKHTNKAKESPGLRKFLTRPKHPLEPATVASSNQADAPSPLGTLARDAPTVVDMHNAAQSPMGAIMSPDPQAASTCHLPETAAPDQGQPVMHQPPSLLIQEEAAATLNHHYRVTHTTRLPGTVSPSRPRGSSQAFTSIPADNAASAASHLQGCDMHTAIFTAQHANQPNAGSAQDAMQQLPALSRQPSPAPQACPCHQAHHYPSVAATAIKPPAAPCATAATAMAAEAFPAKRATAATAIATEEPPPIAAIEGAAAYQAAAGVATDQALAAVTVEGPPTKRARTVSDKHDAENPGSSQGLVMSHAELQHAVHGRHADTHNAHGHAAVHSQPHASLQPPAPGHVEHDRTAEAMCIKTKGSDTGTKRPSWDPTATKLQPPAAHQPICHSMGQAGSAAAVNSLQQSVASTLYAVECDSNDNTHDRSMRNMDAETTVNDLDIQQVDVEEQKRILRDIEVSKNLIRLRHVHDAGRPLGAATKVKSQKADAKGPGKGKQTSIAALFQSKSKGI